MSEKKKVFTVVIGDGQYTKERPYTMLRFAYTALLEDHKVNIFLVEDGIYVGKKNQDPMAYDNNEEDNNYDINADPKTITETTGGTGRIEPVYTLTAGEALTDVTITLENLNTEEALIWEGSLADTEVLVIDTVRWIVEKEGVASMVNMSGQFPRLVANQANSIKVTGFSTTGSLNIKYRDRYL